MVLRKEKYLLLILFFSSVFFTEKLRLIELGRFSIQLHHLIFLIIFLYFIRTKKGKVYLPDQFLTLFFFWLLLISAINIPRFGISGLLINACYVFITIIVIYSVYKGENIYVIEECLVIASNIGLIAIIINDIVNFRAFISFFRAPYGHPVLEYMVGGGENIEASLVAICSIFHLKHNKKITYWIIAAAISVLYVSRTAILINIFVVAWYVYILNRKPLKKLLITITAIFIILVLLYIFRNSLGMNYIISRFANIGNPDEQGSLGRIRMWTYFPQMFACNPLGVGCGNIIKAIASISGLEYGEDNIHNIYMQYLGEEGVFGGGFILSCMIRLLKKEKKTNFSNSLGFFLITYLFQGLLQTRGMDIWMGIPLGLYYATNRKEIIRHEKNNNIV